MNLRSVDLNLLTIFDAIMTEQNISKAAKRIGMSQSAVSNAVVRLRYLLKDELFIRTGHGVIPTPRATEYAKPIRKILDLVVGTLSNPNHFDVHESDRTFNLVLREYGELIALPKLLQWIEEMDSKVSIRAKTMTHNVVHDALRKGEVDIYLTTQLAIKKDFSHIRIANENLVTLAKKNHPKIRKNLTKDIFLSTDHIALEWPDIPTTYVDRALAVLNKKRRCSALVHSLFDMPRIIESTNMICTIPSQVANCLKEAHRVDIFPCPIKTDVIPIYIEWHNNFEFDPGHIAIREKISDIFAELDTPPLTSKHYLTQR